MIWWGRRNLGIVSGGLSSNPLSFPFLWLGPVGGQSPWASISSGCLCPIHKVFGKWDITYMTCLICNRYSNVSLHLHSCESHFPKKEHLTDQILTRCFQVPGVTFQTLFGMVSGEMLIKETKCAKMCSYHPDGSKGWPNCWFITELVIFITGPQTEASERALTWKTPFPQI